MQVNRTNPSVELWFSDFDGPMGTKRVAPPESLAKEGGGEAHFSRVTWPSDRHFAVQWMNRFQTQTVLTLCDTRVRVRLGAIPGIGIAWNRFFCPILCKQIRNRLLFKGIAMQ